MPGHSSGVGSHPLTSREVSALIPVLEDIANAERTTEELAELIIATLDDIRARNQRLAVIVQYTVDQGETLHHAVLGPFGTRSRSAATSAGEGIIGRPTQPGQGRFMLVPAYHSARDAWAAVTPTREERRKVALALAEARRNSDWNPWLPGGPCCHCGLNTPHRCPVHPERIVR